MCGIGSVPSLDMDGFEDRKNKRTLPSKPVHDGGTLSGWRNAGGCCNRGKDRDQVRRHIVRDRGNSSAVRTQCENRCKQQDPSQTEEALGTPDEAYGTTELAWRRF